MVLALFWMVANFVFGIILLALGLVSLAAFAEEQNSAVNRMVAAALIGFITTLLGAASFAAGPCLGVVLTIMSVVGVAYIAKSYA